MPSIVCTPLNIVQTSRDGSRRQQCVVTNSWNVLYLAGRDKRLNYAENWVTNGGVDRVFMFGWHYALAGGGLMIDDTEWFASCRIASICELTFPLLSVRALKPDLTPFPVIMQRRS